MQWLLYFLIGKLFTVVVGAYYYKYLTRPYRIVFYLTGIALLVELYGYYLNAILKVQNAWLFNLYMPVEVWMLGVAGLFLVSNKNLRKIFLLAMALNTGIWMFNIIITSINVFANIAMIAGCILLTVIYTIVMLNDSLFSNKDILKQPVFWLSASTILYFGCDIPYMGLHNFLSTAMPSSGSKLDYINSVLDVIRYPVSAISFILLGRQRHLEVKIA